MLKNQQNGKYSYMDWLLLGILAWFTLRGCMRGSVRMFFALFGASFAILLSWWLCGVLVPTVESMFSASIRNGISQMLDGFLPGTYDDVSVLQAAILQKGSAFGLLLQAILRNVTIDGTLSAGQILAPTISTLVIKVATFVLLFVGFCLIFRVLSFILNKVIKKSHLGIWNIVLGGVFGLVKGLLVFGVVFFVLSLAANLFLSETLQVFLQSGSISNWLYTNLVGKFISLIY